MTVMSMSTKKTQTMKFEDEASESDDTGDGDSD